MFGEYQFLGSAAHRRQFPCDIGQEVAFAGRSNVGKSSAINALSNRTQLARASKIPGRTQTINFFGEKDGARLVDLPGYGYANAPPSVVAAWLRLLQAYIGQRQSLRVVVVLMDIRRPLLALDRRFMASCIAFNRPLHVVLTKADKLSHQAALQSMHRARSQLCAMLDDRNQHGSDGGGKRITLQLLSARKRIGIDELRSTIAAAFQATDSSGD